MIFPQCDNTLTGKKEQCIVTVYLRGGESIPTGVYRLLSGCFSGAIPHDDLKFEVSSGFRDAWRSAGIPVEQVLSKEQIAKRPMVDKLGEITIACIDADVSSDLHGSIAVLKKGTFTIGEIVIE